MQDQKTTSSQRLEAAKKRLDDSLSRLENLITVQNESLEGEKQIRTQVIEDLDKHIENLESILDSNG